MTALTVLNTTPEAYALAELLRCCGVERWARAVLARRPFASTEEAIRIADEAWSTATPEEIMEAVRHHPRIGVDVNLLREKFASTQAWSREEQSAAGAASETELLALRDGNLRYEAKFGFLFVVCATGKSAAQMLTLLEQRLHNDRDTELRVTAGEIAKITRIRLEKL